LSLALHSLKKAMAAFNEPSYPIFANGALCLLDVFEDLGCSDSSLSRIRSRLENERPLVFDDAYLVQRLESVMDKRDSKETAFDELQQLLQEHDAVLGEQWGGFSNLLHATMTPEQRLFRSIAPGYLHESGRRNIEDSLAHLVTVHEIATSFSVDSVFVSFCIVLEALNELAAYAPASDGQTHFTRWIQSLDAKQRLFKLWLGCADLKALSSAVRVSNFSDLASLMDAALYAVTKKTVVSGQLQAEQRIVLDELLRASGLGSIQMYEDAGVLSSAELSCLRP